jgi:hypothetical protein
MVDYILETPELDVFGGPASVTVSTDFGKEGKRGSIYFSGNGEPEQTLTSSQDVEIGDLYINTNSDPAQYSWLYILLPEIGSPVWKRLLRLNPSQFSQISEVTFTAGQGTLKIPTSLITLDATVTTSQFIIRHSFENADGNPVASSFTYSIVTELGVRYLQIVFKGVQFSEDSWTDLSGINKVHTFVSYLV